MIRQAYDNFNPPQQVIVEESERTDAEAIDPTADYNLIDFQDNQIKRSKTPAPDALLAKF